MNKDNSLYWIWLSLALGFSNPKVIKVFNLYDDITAFYAGREFEWHLCGIFTEAETACLSKTGIEKAQDILNLCIKSDIRVIPLDSADYPECLRNIYAPPAVLYVKGKMPDFDSSFSLAMVGTRKATPYGVREAFNFACNLSKLGAVIVSGGALGIDSASHSGALYAGGTTACILGCGINYNYPRQNRKMREEITENGALISEYPPDTAPKPYHFPTRNRIISALSNAVLVIEAGKSSGSLITANCAAEQGRDVFALMGNVDSPMSVGSNELIKDGAVPVTGFRDIVEYYPHMFADSDFSQEYIADESELEEIHVKGKAAVPADKDKKTEENEKNISTDGKPPHHRSDVCLEGIELEVYKSVGNVQIHIDDLSVKLSMPPHKLLPVITKLEIMGLIKESGSRSYQLA